MSVDHPRDSFFDRFVSIKNIGKKGGDMAEETMRRKKQAMRRPCSKTKEKIKKKR